MVAPLATYIDRSVQLQRAALDLLAAFGGDTPDWLRDEAARLERACDLMAQTPLPIDPYSPAKEG
jgi:hypothetical protein